MTKVNYRIIYADTDQMGIVYHANYLKYFEMLRGEVMRENGLTYHDFETMGFSLPVIESHCEYKYPAKYDDVIEITGFVSELKGLKMKFECEIHCGDKLICKGYTIHTCLNKDGRPIKFPEQLVKLYEKSLKI
ncbi:MAG: acyl-CoA thioesterase [bacterium]|nr:acyl-CoA thioesterase [bacterium]